MSSDLEQAGTTNLQQLPSPAYTYSSHGSTGSMNSYLENDMMKKLVGFFGDVNGQLLALRQQQASSMNTLEVLNRDVTNLNDEMKKIKSGTGTRGGHVGRGGRGGSKSRRNGSRG